MAPQLVQRLPEGEDWLYEVKFDGYRALILKDGNRVETRSRNDRDLTRMYPAIAASGLRLNADTAVVDGEIVAVDAEGRPSFQALQHRSSYAGHRIVFYAFDLLHLDGDDLTGQPLSKRRAKLPKMLSDSALMLSQSLPGTVADIVTAVRRLGLEGVVAKRKDSIYEPGEHGGAWQKMKLEQQQEFFVGGYRPGSNGVDALLVGYYEGKDLRFAGKVRAGFVPHVRREIYAKLKPRHMDRCPFVDLPNSKSSRWGGGVTADEMPEMRWVKPEMVVQIRFVEWTAENRVRHACFAGIRSDKKAGEVQRETME